MPQLAQYLRYEIAPLLSDEPITVNIFNMVKLKKMLGECIMQDGISVIAASTKIATPAYINPFSKALSSKTITTQADSNVLLLDESDHESFYKSSLPPKFKQLQLKQSLATLQKTVVAPPVIEEPPKKSLLYLVNKL